MASIADSDAIVDKGRVLPQHQAALTILQANLSNPDGARLRWLDLACGRGQIIRHLRNNLSDIARGRLDYHGYDINSEFTRDAERAASTLGLSSHKIEVGELRKFSSVIDASLRFDFVTLTNTVHEVEPRDMARVLADAVLRLTDSGHIFIYDLEAVEPLELGAIPWTGDDAREIVRAFLDGLGCEGYMPEVGRWQHSKTIGWNLQLQRQHLRPSTGDISSRIEEAMARMTAAIENRLRLRLAQCRKALESLTLFRAETKEENDQKVALLYEYWAVSRALEVRQ